MVKTLKWPVVCLLIVGGLHFVEEMIFPALKDFFTAPVIGTVLLAFGIVTGYRAVQSGGLVNAIVSGAILGLLPIMLDTLGFGVVLGRGIEWGLTAGIFGFSMVVWGALAGAAFSLSRGESRL
jgi:hypothetical protein